MSPADFAAFAETLADAARAVTLGAADRAAEDKNEGGVYDPVTAADREAERVIRALIEQAFPDHGIAGEEFGVKEGAGRHVWSLDPIDGTRAFICGLPSWTTLIALLEDGRPVAGLIDVPALDERYLGFAGAAGLKASDCRRLAEARACTTDPYLFAGAEADGFERLRRAARLTRYGYDAYAYARLAVGSIDVVAESGLKPHDYNALIPVVRAAGGVIGNWRGEDDFSAGQVLAAATPDLFEEAVRVLAV
ncbi:MAG TPA: inositol monophosphatase family protein [Allosphingosinicella sp.]|nr:inositol monophosphatase family protein [Allosphingosinicella sp.]